MERELLSDLGDDSRDKKLGEEGEAIVGEDEVLANEE